MPVKVNERGNNRFERILDLFSRPTLPYQPVRLGRNDRGSYRLDFSAREIRSSQPER